MNEIVTVAGFMLTQALDTLDRTGVLKPFLSGFNKNDELVTITCKELSLELSIPKIVRKFETNSENLSSAAIAFPAEIGGESLSDRESVIIVMVQNYITDEYIVIAQPYSKENGKLEVLQQEFLNFTPHLVDKLDKIEDCFIVGALRYDDAEHIWCERFSRRDRI